MTETNAMDLVYDSLRGLDREEQSRILSWTKKRLLSDWRAQQAKLAPAGFQPEYWCECGSLEFRTDRDDAVDDSDVGAGEVLALDGWAVVKQAFAVRVQIVDAEGLFQSIEIEWFDDREKAEAFAAAMKAPK